MVGRTVITCSESELQRFLIIINIITFFGFLILLKHLIFLLTWIFHTFLRSENDLIGTYGSWALITGATDGIGKAFARGLARRGLNLILVSRSSVKLRSVSDEIRAEFPRSEIRTVEIDFSSAGEDFCGKMKRLEEAIGEEVVRSSGILRSVSDKIRAEFLRSETRTVQIDLSSARENFCGGMKRQKEAIGEEVVRSSGKGRSVSNEIRTVEVDFSDSGEDFGGGMKRLKEAIQEVDLGILVNNVGITYPEAKYFHEVEEEVWRKIVRVNVEGTMAVTKTVMRGMMERRRGAIVNIGSGAGIVVPSHPLYAIYGATKAYVNALSKCLHVQYRHYGIHVQCQVPLYVATKMTAKVASIEKASVFVASAEDYAEAGIRRIGYEVECSPYWSHSLQWYLASFVPHFLLDAWRLSIAIRRSHHNN